MVGAAKTIRLKLRKVKNTIKGYAYLSLALLFIPFLELPVRSDLAAFIQKNDSNNNRLIGFTVKVFSLASVYLPCFSNSSRLHPRPANAG